MSLSGCGSKSSTNNFCAGSTGPLVGSIQNLVLQPQVGGVSLNPAESITLTPAQAFDCRNSSVATSNITYAVSPAQAQGGPVDINPRTGALCAGSWNRNISGGVPDYTTCTGTGATGVSTVTASAGGANSNKILVYVHPLVTSIQLGKASLNCTTDPATNCICGTAAPDPATGALTGPALAAPSCYSAASATSASPYDPNSCVSFGQSAQLVTRFFAGTQNITYMAGHAIFTPQTANLVGIENNAGVVTAQQPGSTVITAQLSQAKSSAGFVSVCPPKTIQLSSVNAKNGAVTVNQNTTEPLTAVVTDTKGVTITGLTLTYTSSNPVPVAVTSNGILPTFPAGAAVNVFCQPPTCNPSPVGPGRQAGQWQDHRFQHAPLHHAGRCAVTALDRQHRFPLFDAGRSVGQQRAASGAAALPAKLACADPGWADDLHGFHHGADDLQHRIQWCDRDKHQPAGARAGRVPNGRYNRRLRSGTQCDHPVRTEQQHHHNDA